MLIINADDLGKTPGATDNILACYRRGLITSASTMVFMRDSLRAVALSEDVGLETGLHLNMTLAFDSPRLPPKLYDRHQAIVSLFRSNKLASVIYFPFIKNKIDYIFKAQFDEYCRIFNKEPEQIDGHHHAHLHMNIILRNILPRGFCVRRNLSFKPGEKNILNRTFRKLIDTYLVRHYCCTDYFFSFESNHHFKRLAEIVSLARTYDVELAVHPERNETMRFLLDSEYQSLITKIPKGTYRMISRKLNKKRVKTDAS